MTNGHQIGDAQVKQIGRTSLSISFAFSLGKRFRYHRCRSIRMTLKAWYNLYLPAFLSFSLVRPPPFSFFSPIERGQTNRQENLSRHSTMSQVQNLKLRLNHDFSNITVSEVKENRERVKRKTKQKKQHSETEMKLSVTCQCFFVYERESSSCFYLLNLSNLWKDIRERESTNSLRARIKSKVKWR